MDAGGKSPLMMASENGQTNTVGRTLTLKPQMFFVFVVNGVCVYFLMCHDVCLCLAEVLVSSAKADLTLQDANKNTALHLACSKVPNTLFSHVLIPRKL